MKPPYFKAWIVFYLVVSVGTALVSILANTTIGVIYEAITSMGGDEHPAYLPAVVSVLVGMPISFLTFRWVIRWIILPRLDTVSPSLPDAGIPANRPSVPPVGPYEAPTRE